MMLSDIDIAARMEVGELVIKTNDVARLPDDRFQPASVDLCLGTTFRVFSNHGSTHIDPEEEFWTEGLEVGCGDSFILHPGEFVLAATEEYVEIPSDLVARLEGKSSLGRLGLLVHATAGFIDPGFRGTITLELSNAATLPIKLRPGMKIGQVSFIQLKTPCARPYGSEGLSSRYQNQMEAAPSRYHLTRSSST